MYHPHNYYTNTNQPPAWPSLVINPKNLILPLYFLVTIFFLIMAARFSSMKINAEKINYEHRLYTVSASSDVQRRNS